MQAADEKTEVVASQMCHKAFWSWIFNNNHKNKTDWKQKK